MTGGSSVISLLLLLLIHAAWPVEAGIFLKAKDPNIIQGAVWIYSNSTLITSIAPDVRANKFQKTVEPLENVPPASDGGTIGVLYNRDESCTLNIQQPIPYPFYARTPQQSQVAKIALVKKQGNCTLVDKIMNAQLEGAIGVIVYDATVTTTDDHKAGVPPNSGITIPAYYVDHSLGVNLYQQLQKMAGVPIHTIPTNDGVNLTTRISVHVALMPAENVNNTAWELTLLVMLVLLGTSIFFSVIMYFYMWKKSQRLNDVVERHRPSTSSQLPMGKALINVARLYQFPTRTIDTLPDEEERIKVETVLSDEKQREALIKSTTLTPTDSQPPEKKIVFSFFRPKRCTRVPSMQSATNLIKVDAPVNNMCVICLEAFKMGDQVRELPCHHEYHNTCIDPWLTSKSGECPLCKFDCSSDSKSQETLTHDPDGLIAAESITGIRGKMLRAYLRFKANRRKRLGQVGVVPDDVEQQRRQSRQSTMVTRTEAPPSPALRAALRAVEVIEAPIALAATINAAVEQDAEQQQELQQRVEESVSLEVPVFINEIDSTPRPSMALSELTTTSIQYQPRLSIALNDDTETINSIAHNSVSTYAPTLDGGLLPDIDVSSISLCSIEIGGLSREIHDTLSHH